MSYPYPTTQQVYHLPHCHIVPNLKPQTGSKKTSIVNNHSTIVLILICETLKLTLNSLRKDPHVK